MANPRTAFVQRLVDGCLKLLPVLTGINLYTYQLEMADRIFFSLLFGDAEEITVEATRQGGKALAVGTPLLTTTGWKTMGTVQVGDYVFAPDGTSTPVTAKSPVFTDHDCYKLTFMDGQTIVADAGHKWTMRDSKTDQTVTVTTEELVGSVYWNRFNEKQCRYRYTMPEPYKMADADLPLDPYVLGVWLGDGTAKRSEITSMDEQIIDRVVAAGYKRSYTYDSTYNGKAKTYGFTGLLPTLKNLNLLGNKHIPEAYFLASPAQRLELLQGLMDTDGSISVRGGAEISLSDLALARDVLTLIRSLGWKVTTNEKLTTHRVSHRMRFHPYSDMNPCTLPRKSARVNDPPLIEWRRRKTTSNALVSVEKVETVNTQCISVEHPEHLYLAGEGFIPTHNSEALADIVATAMIIFPKLAASFPDDPVLQKFKNGIQIGIFAPIDDQADTIFGRVYDRLSSPTAKAFLADPEIDDEVNLSGIVISTKSGSICRRQTAHAKAKIESKTYHFIVIDEAQDADATKVRKSIHPMAVATAGSIIKVGTPAAYKSDYYEAIMRNRRRGTTNGKKNHFAYDWRRAAKENPYYAQSIKKEKDRLGEDSDEFRLSYNLEWLLDRGMFITEEQLEALGDKSMQIVPYYSDSPIVIGIDVAAVHDSTVVTAVWVDWEHPDEFGLYNHRILNWLELHGENWESQYRQICDFCARYYVMRIGVDAQGMGGPVAERLQVLMPGIEVVPLAMNPVDQSARWTHLMQLIQRGLIGWPAHSRTRRLRSYQRFIQQMADVEKEYKGKYLLVGTPKNEKNAHDDFIDSLALACSLTIDFGQSTEVEVMNHNPMLERGLRAM